MLVEPLLGPLSKQRSSDDPPLLLPLLPLSCASVLDQCCAISTDFDRFESILPDLDQFEGCMSFALMIDNLRLQKRRTGFFKTALLCYTPGPSVTLYRPFSTIVPHKYLLKPIHLFLVLWQDSHLQLSIVIETNVHVRVLNRLRDHLENHWSNPMVTKFFDKKRGRG